MIEFGEKIKHLREEKGMTQQTMADRLFVTRQAVSRWESSSRYPDIYTTKKIADLLNISIDELLSGEELREHINKAPVLEKKTEHIIQTIIYTIAMFSYLLMCIFSFSSFLFLGEALKNTPAGRIDAITVFVTIKYIFHTALLFAGIILSAKGKLTPKATGYIMSMPYAIAAIEFLFLFVNSMIQKNGHMSFGVWIADFAVPMTGALCILLYFTTNKIKISYLVIISICFISLFEITFSYTLRLTHITDLGFIVGTVHYIGRTGIVILLWYQAYALEKKIVSFDKCVNCN